jgi:hypothetical protein
VGEPALCPVAHGQCDMGMYRARHVVPRNPRRHGLLAAARVGRPHARARHHRYVTRAPLPLTNRDVIWRQTFPCPLHDDKLF